MGRVKNYLKNIYYNSHTFESFSARWGLGAKLAKHVPANPKIGIAILISDRVEYLEPSLDSLFETNLHGYDVTFLLIDDGSTDPRVKDIIDKPRDPKYKIIREYTPKGHNSWAAAFNKAMRKLQEIDNFDIIGTCDNDVLYHPDWLDNTLKVAIWAKAHHKEHVLGPFSSFNSSDYLFHRVLGTYQSPYGSYVVKERMGALVYLYYTEDFRKLGYYPESKDDETLMTEKFKRMKVRYFSTEKSWVEHIGQVSLLNTWRPTPVANAVYALNLVREGWGDIDLKRYRQLPESEYELTDKAFFETAEQVNKWNHRSIFTKLSPLTRKALGKFKHKVPGYLQVRYSWSKRLRNFAREYNVAVDYRLVPKSSSDVSIDIIIPALERDIEVLKHMLPSARKFINHPIHKIKIVSPQNEVMQKFCKENDCEFVDESKVLPITVKDIDYKADGMNRAGWLFQQLLKWADNISETENYLVLDSDTIFLSPQVFIQDGKTVFELSDEYHLPYFRVFEKLTGEKAECPYSFVAHHMMMNKTYLGELKQLIETKHNKKWYEAIIDCADKTIVSGFSEFETYGNFMLNNHRDQMIFKYFYNHGVPRSQLPNAADWIKGNTGKYKSISFQIYQ